jgi:uncharacterized cupredoxin-like copper-binding protein
MSSSARAACLLILLTAAGNSAAADRTIELVVPREAEAARLAEPRVLRVVKGDAVRLRIASDSAGEVHLHGYRLDARVAPGKIAELSFTAHATGRYRIEWHVSGTQSSSHHGPPLAVLEVHPK